MRDEIAHGEVTKPQQHVVVVEAGDRVRQVPALGTSMMLVPTDPFDVVPRRRLVAKEALTDVGMHLPGDHLRDHLEVHHPMAWRLQMALCAIGRVRRWMDVTDDAPSARRMAGRTVGAELALMAITAGMAGGAVEAGFFGMDQRAVGPSGMKPWFENPSEEACDAAR